MKIVIDIQPIFKYKTGIGWYTQKLLKQLNSNEIIFEGHGFNFLNRNNIQNDLANLKFKNKINSLMPYGIYRRIWHYLPISYNALFDSNADIFHFFNYIVPPKIKGKVIVTVYDMVYKLYPETMTKRNYKRLDKELKRSVDRADKIITISENSKNEIIKFLNVDATKIEIVYPGIDRINYTKKYSNDEINKVKKKYKLPSKYILYLGTLEPRKNIVRIIESYSKLKTQINEQIYLVIAGKKGWMYEEIFKKVESLGLENDVIFTGYVDEIDKHLLYKMSEVFVFPSLYEGFGMPVLEAMAAGVPVITSNTSALPEVVGDAGILINPNDVEELANAMKKVLEDKDLKQKLIKKGLTQSLKFSWEKSARKLLEIYKEVGKNE
jgi:glycosyltransferase involved in cell wall biosynthesis